MSIRNLEISKELRKEGKRLGRDGLSQRINDLVLGFAKDNPEGNYREGIILAGKLHAIFLATGPNDYWREVAERGFDKEVFDIKKFQKRDEGQN
jgi:hypothetical protein